jgi:hypothetical protein
MKAYTYKNKKTGRIVQSDTPLSSKEYVLVTRVQNMQMKGAKISRKRA